MIKDRSSIFLKRLVVVTHSGAIAYDEIYHQGINIIRGQNSSGKSTIANFIFYVLGGDFNSWTTEAIKCKDVIAEVGINGVIITLKRHISENGLQPMSIYWNNYDEAKKDSINWQTFSYKGSTATNTASFTNVLFEALSFPEVKNEVDSNITMHQILRLLYIDQDTPTQSLFRYERFDLPLTRQTIAEVLLGIYDDELYSLRLAYRNAIKENDEKKKQYDSLNIVYGKSGTLTSLSNIQKEIELARSELTTIDQSIVELREKDQIRTNKRTALNSENIQTQLIDSKNNIRGVKSKINQYEMEIADSRQFVVTLEKRLNELNNSLLTRKILGELPLTHCPQCLSPLEDHIQEGHCILCKQPLTEEAEKANARRLKLEMELQIKESKSLLSDKERILSDLHGELPILTEKARTLQKQLDLSIETNQTTRDERIDILLISKGGCAKKIEFLIQQIKAVEMLELLKRELAELAGKIEKFRLDIQQKEEQQQQKLYTAMLKIREYTLFILKNDLDRQNEFRTGNSTEIYFQKDTYALDGGNNFSASSKVYFKNAVLFSIFFASLELDFFRYPRFVLCDNMEDKGMEKERTQNFQRLIAAMSERYKDSHQIIFTTSMIDDGLNNSNYCVGDYYNRENKTLKIQ